MYAIVFILTLFVPASVGQVGIDHCLVDNVAGCGLGRPPIYMIMAPRRIRADQVFQVFATILRMEYGENAINVRISVLQGDREYASSVLKFERPSSRLMQLKMPTNAEFGKYRLRVEGQLDERVSGNVFFNETDIEFTPKHASVFIQMSKPIYKQEQMVHFRVIPVRPDLMPKYGNLIIYVEDPTGVAVKRWQSLQTNAGGIVSESFQLSDQPNYGTWNIRVDGFGFTYRRPFIVEEFWEPRFDVNVSVPAYVMDNATTVIHGVVLANHTSGRPCVGNASLTAFFIPREEIWNATRGWEKPYHDAMNNPNKQHSGVPLEVPSYREMRNIPVQDYHLYFAYEYRFVNYFKGRIDFTWTKDELMEIAKRGGETTSLVNAEIVFFANITDWYSGLNRTGWAGTLLFDNEVSLKWVGGNIRTFKPGSTLRVQVAVSQYDGRPVTNGGSVTIVPTVSSMGSQLDMSANSPQTRTVIDGIAQFDLFLGFHVTRFSITASYHDPRETLSLKTMVNPNFVNSNTKTIQMLGTKYYSPTNTYISVSTSTFDPQVNEYMVFHVTVSHFVPKIFYQVVAQSNVIIGDELEMTSRQKTFSISLSREMVPTARLVVYFLREPEEIVSDVLSFFVNGTRQNQVSLGINQGKDFTRNTIEFNAKADPGSYVAFSGMLLDLYSRGMSDGITENKLIDELLTYDELANSSYRHLWRVSDTDYEYRFFHGTDYGIDANTTLLSAGLLVLTDADVIRLPNQNSCNQAIGQYPCFSGIESECFTTEQRCNGQFDGCPNDGADEWGCSYEEKNYLFKSPMERVSRVMRYYDNSSWAWQEIFVKPDGRVDFRVEVPKYPLTWVINGISISQELGLGIMQRPVRYDATRAMYIQVEHPKYIVWGEQVGVRVTVFNNWHEDDYMEVLVTMHAGEDTEFVTVGEMGYVTSYSPTTHKGDHQTIVFLEPGDSQDIYMPIVPAKTFRKDKLTFRVSATSFMVKDEYVGEMYVKPNGVQNYFHTPYLIDLIRYPSIDIPQFKVNVPEYFRKPEYRLNLYVPQSPKGMNTVFGDVVTPGFFEDYLNAENILYRPYGSGEMVTFNFAYNLLALLFMRSSNQLEMGQTKRVLREMNIALQRMLGYMNAADGSFRMFRDDEHSSLWLTAFVGKNLAKAGDVGDWEQDLYIPQVFVSKIVNYICSRQNTTTGAFEPSEHEIAYDRKMASLKDMKSSVMTTHTIPLTAYVLIALYEMTDFTKGTVPCLETAKRNAANFLQRQRNQLGQDDIFFMAITAYALSLSSTSHSIVNDLWRLKRNDSDFTYFADQLVYENPTAIQNNVRYLMPRQELLNDAYAVQATAYALMAHIMADRDSKIERDMSMAWINTMRNSFGGFSSTQDTIVAMEALWRYTLQDFNRNEFDLSVVLESMGSAGWQSVIQVAQNSFTDLRRIFLPMDGVYGFVIPTAQGVGRAMLQLTVTANVEYEELMKTQQHYDNKPDEDLIQFFDVQIQTSWSGRNDSIMLFTSCVSWLYTERSLTSGLAVLEVDIPTGFIVMNDTLRSYVRSRVVPNLKRAEFYGRKVVFYFDYLDQSKTCVDFRGDRWYPIANTTREHRIRVYDYYEPGMHRTRLYTVQNLFLMNICFVCGSYQCPYCPYFNAAYVARASLGLCLLVIVLSLLHRAFHIT
ncbi:alpha-2-macroglobulin-like [Physella acuta]|uniref:alpha-2-macroglobulin-like n=1 Tax=Physella acuta TaxID=109671 RepID=UPI0027DC7F0D|nr:alpha-2-macroglobulin-like [Physella acuta]